MNQPDLEELREKLIKIEFPDGLQVPDSNLMAMIRKGQEARINQLLSLFSDYSGERELIDWVEHKARVWTFENIDPIPNGSYINVKDLIVKVKSLQNPADKGRENK